MLTVIMLTLNVTNIVSPEIDCLKNVRKQPILKRAILSINSYSRKLDRFRASHIFVYNSERHQRIYFMVGVCDIRLLYFVTDILKK